MKNSLISDITQTIGDMLDLYEESAIEGMESGLYNCLAHPDLFMRSYPKFDHHCATISRHICRTAARLNIPLEYNIGYVAYNEEHGLNTYPCPNFVAHSLPMKDAQPLSVWMRDQQ